MLLLLSLLALASGSEVDSALHVDDQCVSEECALNALQLRGLKEQEDLQISIHFEGFRHLFSDLKGLKRCFWLSERLLGELPLGHGLG